jgi:hypothetical protein
MARFNAPETTEIVAYNPFEAKGENARVGANRCQA